MAVFGRNGLVKAAIGSYFSDSSATGTQSYYNYHYIILILIFKTLPFLSKSPSVRCTFWADLSQSLLTIPLTYSGRFPGLRTKVTTEANCLPFVHANTVVCAATTDPKSLKSRYKV